MLIQNIEHSYYIVVLRKYTNFVSFFSPEMRNVFHDKINADLQSKIRDANKCGEHSSEFVPRSLHIQHKMLL